MSWTPVRSSLCSIREIVTTPGSERSSIRLNRPVYGRIGGVRSIVLLSRLSGGSDTLMTLLEKDILRIDFQAGPEVPALRTLMSKYKTVPMSFADACLVRMSELEPRSILITLDSDFTVYRRHRRRRIPMIMPN